MNSPQHFPPPGAQSYYEGRWRQLNDLVIAHSEGALNALLAVNGGAVAGMLAFIGAVSEIRQMRLSLWTLGIFVLGLLVACAARAHALECMKALQVGWIRDYQSYASGQITWQELNERDGERVKRWERLGPILGYGCVLIFLIGLACATKVLWALPTQ
ncbi:hypothetical protein [Cupriavidus sp. DL-D2]|uniref:hypothetical protein n=1 Tax=Cupriavidus sp. DL-D2 TaxID=3144974 RepID=UPI00321443EB